MTKHHQEDPVLKSFSDRSQCKEWLQEKLNISTDSYDVQLILDCLVSTCEKKPDTKSEVGFGLRVGQWVVRETDLKLFDALTKTLVTLASIKFILHDMSAASVTALIMGTLEVLRNARDCGAWLAPAQVNIVAFLESQRGLPIPFDKMLAVLLEQQPAIWTKAALRRELNTLAQLPTRSGFLSIVESNDRDEWLLSST